MAAGTVARAFIGIDLGYVALRLALCARETHLHGALLRWSGPSANRDSGSPGSEWGDRALQQSTNVLGHHTAVRRTGQERVSPTFCIFVFSRERECVAR